MNIVAYDSQPGTSTGIGSKGIARVGSVTINAPVDGHVIITATASLQFINASTNGFMLTGIITELASPTFDNIGRGIVVFHSLDITKELQNAFPWAQTLGFPVTKGSHTFYLYFSNNSNSGQNILNPSMTAIYSTTKN